MTMGGSKQTTTSSQSRDPWAPAQDQLKSILGNADTLSQNQNLFTPQYSDTYNNALNQVEHLGTRQSAANQFLRPVVEQSIGNMGTGQNTLTSAANGAFLGVNPYSQRQMPTATNPYLDQLIQTSANNTANNVNGQFSAAGRYGSGAHTDRLTKVLGEQELGARYKDYDAEHQRLLQYAQLGSNNYNAERGQQLTAANQLFGQGFQGAQLAPGLDNADLAQAQLLQQVGAARNDQLNAANQAPLRAQEWNAGQVVPIAGLGGTSDGTNTSTQPSNTFGKIMGGVTMAAGLATGNPMLMASGLGGLSGGGGGGGGGGGLMGGLGSEPVMGTTNWAPTVYGPGYSPPKWQSNPFSVANFYGGGS